MEFKDSKTKKNLEAAFSGESQARNMYYYFASVARKEGFEQISQIFLEAAENEKEHAKIWFKYLDGIKNTEENIKRAINGESYELGRLGSYRDRRGECPVHFDPVDYCTV